MLSYKSSEAPGVLPILGQLWPTSSEHSTPYLSKAAHHLLYQRPHGSDVDDLEVVHIDRTIHIDVLPYLSEHAHQGHIGLASALRQRSKMSPMHLGVLNVLIPLSLSQRQRIEHVLGIFSDHLACLPSKNGKLGDTGRDEPACHQKQIVHPRKAEAWAALTVGAHSSRFSSVSRAARYSLLWIRFSVLKPSKPAWAYLGSFSTGSSCWKGEAFV